MAKDPRHMAFDELVAEVHRLRKLVEAHQASEDIWMESGVSSEGKPFVQLHWGESHGQLTPDEARQHALKIIETADAAEFDAALMEVMGQGGDPNLGLRVLGLMRMARGGSHEASARG